MLNEPAPVWMPFGAAFLGATAILQAFLLVREWDDAKCYRATWNAALAVVGWLWWYL